MKKSTLTFILLAMLVVPVISQSTYDQKFKLFCSTTTRDAEVDLLIKNGPDHTFTGILIWDGIERDVFGWYTESISEGPGYMYNTSGMVFQCRLDEGFEYQQLFKGLFNHDKSYISGTYFFWGNEFIFRGTAEASTPPSISCGEPVNGNTEAGMCTWSSEGNELLPSYEAPEGLDKIVNDYNGEESLAGASFPAGITVVNWTITDLFGNSASCSQEVVVIDNEAPVLTCVSPEASYNADADKDTWTVPDTRLDPAAMTDNCTASLSATNNFNDLASLQGAAFPVGTTTVEWTVTDNSGNRSTCSYDIVVNAVQGNSDPLAGNAVQAYPNPVGDILHLSEIGDEQSLVKVVNMEGIVLKEGKISKQIEVGDLTAGAYLLVITDKEGKSEQLKFEKN